MIYFYTLLYSLLLPFLLLGSLFSKKLRQGLIGRMGLKKRIEAVSPTTDLYWFHIASSGEFEQAVAILDALKERKKCSVFLSYFSPTAKKAIRLEEARRQKAGKPVSWDWADYLPFDFPWVTRHAVKKLRPRAFVAIHRELWPGLFSVLEKEKVPTFLFATFWPKRTQKKFLRYRPWLRNVRYIGAVDQESAEFIQTALPEISVGTIGDSRIDRVFQRQALTQASAPWSDFLTLKKNIICASIWEEDLKNLFPLLRSVFSSYANWRVLLVPHETRPEKMRELQKKLKDQKIEMRLWSHWLQSPDDTSHLIVDGVGFLAELYRNAEFVFVGGSFKGRVHNVLEPAAYAKPILTGPHIWNSLEACELQKESTGLKSAPNGEVLRDLAETWMEDETLLKEASLSVRDYLEKRRGAASRYAELLLQTDLRQSPK